MSGAGSSKGNPRDRRLPGWVVALWTAALVALVAGLVAARHLPGEGFTALPQFDEEFASRALPALRAVPHHVRPTGYDGQFYAQLALDPGLRDPAALRQALDAPAYRARRILLPALAAAAGAGNAARTLDAYALLNPLFWLGFLALLLRACRPLSLPAMACVTALALSGGAVESIRLALTDLPSAALLLAAALLAMRGTPGAALGAGAAGALAGLARDSAAASAGLLLLPVGEWMWARPGEERRALLRRRAAAIVLAAAPVLLWAAHVGRVFPGEAGQGAGAGDNFGPPCAAALARCAEAARQLAAGAPPFGQESFVLWTVAGLHLQAFWLLRRPRPEETLWRMALPSVLLLFFFGPALWRSHLAAARALLPMTVAFDLLLLPELRAGRKRAWAWFAAGNAFSLFGVIKFWTYVS